MKELVDMLVNAGMDRGMAEQKVQAILETIRKVRPGETEERVKAIAKLQVLQFLNTVRRSNAKIMKGIVIAYSDYRDVLANIKSAALEEYKRDPQKALMEGLVRIADDGTVIPLDNRVTLQSGEPNPNFGKPIGSIFRRDLWMIIDGKLRHAFGNVKDVPQIGYEYSFAGIEREDGSVFVSKMRPFVKVQQCKDIWNIVEKLPVAKNVSEGLDQPYIAYRGITTFVTETVTENYLIVLDDLNQPTGEGVAVFITPERVTETPFVGAEMFVIGRVGISKTESGRDRFIINGFGAIVNPNSLTVLPEVDEILWQ